MPKPGQARAVQIDVDPARIGLRYPVEVGLVGDSQCTLRALSTRLERQQDRSFLDQARAGMERWWKLMAERGSRDDRPMKPQVVAWELGKRLADNAIVSCDSGTVATWFARQIRARRGQMFSLSGNLASMANGLPYAIAAQIAYPQRQCIAFVGDGGFSMLMAEFVTAVKYQLPIKVVVMKNNSLGRSSGSRWFFSATRNMAAIWRRSILPLLPAPAAPKGSPSKIRRSAVRYSIKPSNARPGVGRSGH